MNRSLQLSVCLVLAAVVAGCTKPPNTSKPGNVAKPAAAVVVKGRLFLATLAEDGLRAVDISTSGTPSFVPAPNPMFGLEIPTVRWPTGLVGIDQDGVRPMVVSVSTLDDQLRVVDADALVALGAPVPLPGAPAAVCLGPDGQTIFVAVDTGDPSSPGLVAEVDLTSDALDPSGTVGTSAAPATVTATWPVDALPGGIAVSSASGTLQAWVSDTLATQVVNLDLTTGNQTRIEAGDALGTLVASPKVSTSDTSIEAGAYVYGLALHAPHLVAFDAQADTIAAPVELSGQVLPVSLPSIGLALTTMPAANINRPSTASGSNTTGPAKLPIAVFVALVDGRIAVFDGVTMAGAGVPTDAVRLRPTVSVSPPVNTISGSAWTTDLDKTAPVLVTRANPTYDPNHPAKGSPDEPAVRTTPGVTRSRTWKVGWHVSVPKQAAVLGRLVASNTSAIISPILEVPDLDIRVQPGDTVKIDNWYQKSAPAGCDAYTAVAAPTYQVESVDVGAQTITMGTVTGGAPLPTSACFKTAFVYTVVSGGYMVQGSGVDTIYRLTPGDLFRYDGTRWLKTNPVILGPAVQFTLSSDQDPSQMSDGAERTLTITSGATPVIYTVDYKTLASGVYSSLHITLAPVSLPGQPVVLKASSGKYSSGTLYVPYVGSGYVVGFDVESGGGQTLVY